MEVGSKAPVASLEASPESVQQRERSFFNPDRKNHHFGTTVRPEET